jgi:hypothetical protein
MGELANDYGGVSPVQMLRMLSQDWRSYFEPDGYELYRSDWGESILASPDGRMARWSAADERWVDWSTGEPMPPEWSHGITPNPPIQPIENFAG